jgi:NAD(P)-dependent dehydrogenase (short-subunit alcohol dehydrogenase family)
MQARDTAARARRSDVVVITGGSSGVGRATARRFAKDGASIAVLARGGDALAADTARVFSMSFLTAPRPRLRRSVSA